jgi:hypothetical protein
MNPVKLFRLIRSKNPNDTFKMHIVKTMVNISVKLVNRFIPTVKPSKLNTVMLNTVQQVLVKKALFERDCITKREGKQADNNFVNLLNVGFKTVFYLAETDPYYELWLGEFLKQTQQVRNAQQKKYGEQLTWNIECHPEFKEMLSDVSFQERCFNLKTCGGLQVMDEVSI